MLTKKNRAFPAISTLLTTLLAVALFTGCQPSGPKSLMLGDKYVRQAEYAKALKYLARAAQLLPELPEVWNLQGLAYHGMQQPGRAADAYQRALRINRNFAPAHFNLGVLLLEQERTADAITELNSYVALRPEDDHGWSRLGAALVRSRRTDQAEQALDRALKLNAKNADAHNSLGLVHIQRKRPREAMQSFNSALQCRPGYGAALLNQAIVAQQFFGNNQIALERYRAFLSSRPDPRAAAAVQLAIRQIEQASIPAPAPVALADLTTNTGISELLRSNLAQQALQAREAERAQQIETPLPTSTNTVVQVAPARTNPPPEPQVAFAPGTNAPTAPAPLPAARHAPQTTVRPIAAGPSIRTNTPVIKDVVAEPPLEVQVVEVDQSPELGAPRDLAPIPGTRGQARSATASNEFDRPLIAPRKKVDDESRGLLARLKQASPTRWFEHEEPKTVPLPPVRPVRTPENTPGVSAGAAPSQRARSFPRYQYRKDLAAPKGNRAQAQKLFAEGAAAQQQRRFLDAIALYRQAIAADRSYFEPRYNLALAAYRNKDLPLALSANEEAVALNPRSEDARYNFALLLREANYGVDAANELKALIEIAPNEARAHLALANLYAQELEEPNQARVHYQRFLELAPTHPEAPAVRQWLFSRR